ncbi:hypothetical protein [Nannocystis pusilla]|uniref:hypothetical protein n=1 Tax=Nannocystis pusilla TaxID=889268 RepID=UPI003B81DAFF
MRLRLLLALAFVPSCIDFVLDADLDGPRVIASDLPGPRAVEVPVAGPWRLEFSEPLDPRRLRVALLAWETVGACELTPECDEGSCERGRCQVDPIADADLRALERGDPLDGAIPLGLTFEDLPERPGTTLHITPERPLAAHARHSLLVFARDRRGAPLVDADGEAVVWRRDLVTAGPASSGPAPRLVSPPPGADLVPTDLARVDTAFARPVAAAPGDTLQLRAADHQRELVDPVACPGWVPGLCLSWRTAEPLAPGAVYELAGGALRDRAGRPLVPAREFAAFRTGPGPDLSPPDLGGLVFAQLGRCLHARLHAREPLRLRLTAGPAARELVAPPAPSTSQSASTPPPAPASPPPSRPGTSPAAPPSAAPSMSSGTASIAAPRRSRSPRCSPTRAAASPRRNSSSWPTSAPPATRCSSAACASSTAPRAPSTSAAAIRCRSSPPRPASATWSSPPPTTRPRATIRARRRAPH